MKFTVVALARFLYLKMNTKIIVIVGPTASGKTAVAVELAKRLDGEIISADSRTIFQGMDIGTAKPDLIERGGVPHFGFDLVRPDERFTVVDWKNYAKEKIAEILARGKQPIVVGGTGLYVDALVFDYQFSEEAKKGELDRKKMGDEYKIYGILTDREELGARIKKRVQAMFNEELYTECRELASRYDFGLPSMKSNIYRYVWDYLKGVSDLEEAINLASTSDFQLAKRQMTWFKRNPEIKWYKREEILEKILAEFQVEHY